MFEGLYLRAIEKTHVKYQIMFAVNRVIQAVVIKVSPRNFNPIAAVGLRVLNTEVDLNYRAYVSQTSANGTSLAIGSLKVRQRLIKLLLLTSLLNINLCFRSQD